MLPDVANTSYRHGPLRVLLTGELRHRILERLRRDQHAIVVDLTNVTSIDAGGVGQLVCAYNIAAAAEGTLHVEHANPRVRGLLERAGLYALLSEGRKAA
jgi:anti-anti-sigma factor